MKPLYQFHSVNLTFSTCSIFSIVMYSFGLIWTDNCDFGTGILISCGVICFWYFCYFVWVFKNRNINLEDYAKDSNRQSNISSITKESVQTEL